MKRNEVMIFENEELNLQVRTILNPDGSISVSAEDTAIGFGWYKTEVKNGREYVSIRWERMNGFSAECGFAHEWSKKDYIPESLFYMLGFKAGNERAVKYQQWLAVEVLPTLRKTGTYDIQKREKKPTPKPPLPSVNMAAKIMQGVYKEAGVDPLYIAVAIDNLYKKEAGIDFGVPFITDETMPKLYDCTEIAKELGIMSKSGKLHIQAVSAIIQHLNIKDNEMVTTAFSQNGHDDVTVQYKPSVFDKVKEWIIDNKYPTVISGHGKNYTVTYKVMEVA